MEIAQIGILWMNSSHWVISSKFIYENVHSTETTDLEFILFQFTRVGLWTMSEKGEPVIKIGVVKIID